MAFEIYLPQARIAASRGLWAERLPIDDLDAAVATAPDRTAFVGRNSALRQRSASPTPSSASAWTRSRPALSSALRIGRGDVVAFQLPNWWEFTALFDACSRIGAVANPLMPIFRQRELRFMMGFAEAEIAVGAAGAVAQLRPHRHDARIRPDLPKLAHVLAVGGTGEESFEKAFLDRQPVSAVDHRKLAKMRPGSNEVVQLIYTSGTSGEPKAVMHTSNTVLAPAECFIRDIPLAERDILFMGSPYAHQTGFLYGMLMPIILKTTAGRARHLVGAGGGGDDRTGARHLQHGLDAVRLRHGQTSPRSLGPARPGPCARGCVPVRLSHACWCSGPKPR